VAGLGSARRHNSVIIHFAHRTFQWSSEARGKAAVHCVIIGFALHDCADKRLFDYESVRAEAHEIKAKNINPYLVDAANIFLEKRRKPICNVPPIVFGSMANDGGHLLLSDDEKDSLIAAEPGAAKWIRPFMQVEELLYGSTRWCLWLEDISPAELKKLPLVSARVLEVKKLRKESDRDTTKALADYPTLFGTRRFMFSASLNQLCTWLGFALCADELKAIIATLLVLFTTISRGRRLRPQTSRRPLRGLRKAYWMPAQTIRTPALLCFMTP
jgi:hypothetical protein